MAPRHPHTVVAGYDGSQCSRAALALAAHRAGASGHVIVVHAFNPAPGFHAGLRERAKAMLDGLLLDGNDALLATNYEVELISGRPADVIADAARSHDADEIVVGARGVGRFRGLLGRVTHELLEIADRPVVVLPARAASDYGRRTVSRSGPARVSSPS